MTSVRNHHHSTSVRHASIRITFDIAVRQERAGNGRFFSDENITRTAWHNLVAGETYEQQRPLFFLCKSPALRNVGGPCRAVAWQQFWTLLQTMLWLANKQSYDVSDCVLDEKLAHMLIREDG